MKKTLEVITRSAAETKKVGKVLGRNLGAGDVVALQGDLGSGKTTLVKGIAMGLGVRSEKLVSSPTYILIHEYRGRKKIYHLDWYRLRSVKGLDAEFAEECFASDGVTLVEWPERGGTILPKRSLRVRLSHRGDTTRCLRITFPEKR